MTSGSEMKGIKGDFATDAMGIEKVTVTTDGSGNASVATNFIQGEILKVTYDAGTVDASTTCTIKTTTTLTTTSHETIDSYNVGTSGSAFRYPRTANLSGSAGDNKWVPFLVSDTLTVAVASGQASKTFYVYIYYR